MRINICIDIGPTPSGKPSVLDEIAKIVGGLTVGYKGAEWLSPAVSSILDAFRKPSTTERKEYKPQCEASHFVAGSVAFCLEDHGHVGFHRDVEGRLWADDPVPHAAPSGSQA